MASGLAGIAGCQACIWDSDTLAMEQVRYPGALTIMAGNFPRHSSEFYAWRIEHSRALLAKDPRNAALRDDLAVALHKTGRHAEAIQVMMDSLALTPDRYETLSNLGTFTIYAEDLPASRSWLRKALAINPDAHFGREKYQLWLVEQLMLQADPAALTEVEKDPAGGVADRHRWNYAQFVMWRQKNRGWSLDEPERAAALRGVVGMMQFADHKNPVLLEALGDILAQGNPRENSVHLAIQAYESGRDYYGEAAAAKKRLTAKIEEAHASYMAKAAPDMKKLKKELAAAQAAGAELANRVREDELRWIAAGLDAGKEFEKKYLRAAVPASTAPSPDPAVPAVKFRMPAK